MAETIKISELVTQDISLNDFLVKADASGVATKNTIQNLATLISTSGGVAFKGSLSISDTPNLDGWYFAEESGTYTNAGNLVIDIDGNLVILIVSNTQTVFSKVDIPLGLEKATPSEPLKDSVKFSDDGQIYDKVKAELIDKIENSFPYNDTYNTNSLTTLNLTTSELMPLGVVKSMKFKTSGAGVAKFAFLRPLGVKLYKPIKYFEGTAVSGENTIELNEFIDEDFHLCILAGSVQIKTASSGVTTEPYDLHYFLGEFTDSSEWTSSNGRGTNIEIEIDVNTNNFPTKTTGKSITYIGDSITDFCDSPSSNGVQYIGFDTYINRYIKFKTINNEGYSGIRIAQSSGFANTKVAGLPVSDYYSILITTNDFALATQSTIGTQSDYDNNTGVNTVYGAFRVLIDGIYSKNPYAKIIISTPTHRDYSSLNSWNSVNSNGDTMEDFAECIRNISRNNGLYLIDNLKECQINRNNFSLTTYDDLHPKTRGYQEIGESFVRKMYDKF